MRRRRSVTRVFDGQREGLTRDDILDKVTLYWLTNTAVSPARLYSENKLLRPETRRDPGCRERLAPQTSMDMRSTPGVG